MHPVFASFEALAVLFLMSVFGWLLRARRIITPPAMPVLSTIALDAALPCLVFTVILKRLGTDHSARLLMLPLAWMLFTIASLLLSIVAGYAARPSLRREFRVCCFYQNALFFPLAILTGMFGADSTPVAQLFLMTFLFPSMFFNTCGMFFQPRLSLNWRKTLHPVVFGTVAAMLITLAGLSDLVPDMLVKAMQQVGAVSVPLLMLLLGARIRDDYEHRGPVYWREIVLFVCIRNIGFPVLFLAVMPALRLSGEVGLLLLLQAAMPPVTAAPVIIGRNGGNETFAGQLLVASYLASAATIPGMLWLFDKAVGQG